jgi:hypothetical protein
MKNGSNYKREIAALSEVTKSRSRRSVLFLKRNGSIHERESSVE